MVFPWVLHFYPGAGVEKGDVSWSMYVAMYDSIKDQLKRAGE